MSIIWKYIDKSSASINVLRDYDYMKNVVSSVPDTLKEEYSKTFKPASAQISDSPKTHNPLATETRIINYLDKLDVLQERYFQAVEYMRWFSTAWATLTDTEQNILREYYMGGNQRSGANFRLQDKLSYSEPQIERMRKRALNRLSTMLFGIYK